MPDPSPGSRTGGAPKVDEVTTLVAIAAEEGVRAADSA
ncbi:hypothetical protein STRIP9103_08092 [Streptomyces ipomoeae 91-03]|uniref:Uncharacterized protein n=1 Tax=Streptomyces ipomoeae 91-03 TaxID=698759 RepID=L1L9R9_9ACTN|nr:hypothetical protein STRIP9103_08092 [Streptomyces ipomoeae 91-03]